MALGRTPMQPGLLSSTVSFCEGRLAPNSIYAVLHRECHTLFPDEMFADLFAGDGRRSVPPMIVAVVMVLQRLEGLSDREAVDRFAFDVRWKYAAGGLDFDHPGFVHTVLVDMRARLAASDRPDRIFDRTVQVARQAGLIGRRRVLDSTPIYDAVATQDTVTLIRSAIRGLLRAADHRLRSQLRGVLSSGDAYNRHGQAGHRLDRRHRAGGVDRLTGQGRLCAAGGTHPGRAGGPGGGAAGHRGRSRRGTGRGRGVPDRPQGGQRPSDLHSRSAGPARAQDRLARLRRLQGPYRRRSRQ
ncbi:transposase [Sphaerimonospora mesophila]|uniref:transposase n=1 Tax=Sphaerimonospora mesophila TaxID=37483 RepID=UPI000B1104E3